MQRITRETLRFPSIHITADGLRDPNSVLRPIGYARIALKSLTLNHVGAALFERENLIILHLYSVLNNLRLLHLGVRCVRYLKPGHTGGLSNFLKLCQQSLKDLAIESHHVYIDTVQLLEIGQPWPKLSELTFRILLIRENNFIDFVSARSPNLH